MRPLVCYALWALSRESVFRSDHGFEGRQSVQGGRCSSTQNRPPTQGQKSTRKRRHRALSQVGAALTRTTRLTQRGTRVQPNSLRGVGRGSEPPNAAWATSKIASHRGFEKTRRRGRYANNQNLPPATPLLRAKNAREAPHEGIFEVGARV